MANLPDLNTSTIGYIAYWNAIDQGGVTDINPDEVINSSNVQSHTVYDNGIEGVYKSPRNNREFNFRAKEDGWIVAYLDRTNTFASETTERFDAVGYFDILNWSEISNSTPPLPSIEQHELERAINDLQSQFSNSASITYSSTDVGLFNYEYPDASVTSAMGSSVNADGGNQSITSGFSYTADTDIMYAVATGAGAGWEDNEAVGFVAFEGFTIANKAAFDGGGGTIEYGAADLLNRNLIPDSGTEYNQEISAENRTGDVTGAQYAYGTARGEALLIWG